MRAFVVGIVAACMGLASLAQAQSTAAQLREFHDQIVAAIRSLANRPLLAGDTMLTWNPQPGGLTHTVFLTDSTAATSLLRGDGMIGTATSVWKGGALSSFQVDWTTADSATRTIKKDVSATGRIERG